MSKDYMEKPCQHCPFRRDVTPFLHPDRAYEIAASASNPYSNFPCHKTLEHDEDSEDGKLMATECGKTCAGWLTMQAGEDDRFLPEGFEPDWEGCYSDAYEMEDVYRMEWEDQRSKYA